MVTKRSIFYLLLFAVITIVISIPNSVYAKKQKPLIWDIDKLNIIRIDQASSEEAKKIIQYADNYCELPPLSVTQNKKLSFGPSNHYYSSIGPYRWPDADHPGKYYLKDGVINPDYRNYDSNKLYDMVLRCQWFSKAFYLTKDKKYYNAFITQIKVWFLNQDTYMEPTFMYAQVIPDDNVNNVGTSSGMIEAYVFNTLIESLRLVNCTYLINRKTYKSLQEWFSQFASWSEKQYSDYFNTVNNNISLAFDVTMTNLHLFAGENKKAKCIADNFASKRINMQIEDDGKQPAELIRTRAAYYSLYNISHIIDFCCLARYWDNHYLANNGGRIEKAFDFIQQYLDKPETFPYQQITSWDECRSMFNEEKQRILLLSK